MFFINVNNVFQLKSNTIFFLFQKILLLLDGGCFLPTLIKT